MNADEYRFLICVISVIPWLLYCARSFFNISIAVMFCEFNSTVL